MASELSRLIETELATRGFYSDDQQRQQEEEDEEAPHALDEHSTLMGALRVEARVKEQNAQRHVLGVKRAICIGGGLAIVCAVWIVLVVKSSSGAGAAPSPVLPSAYPPPTPQPQPPPAPLSQPPPASSPPAGAPPSSPAGDPGASPPAEPITSPAPAPPPQPSVAPPPYPPTAAQPPPSPSDGGGGGGEGDPDDDGGGSGKVTDDGTAPPPPSFLHPGGAQNDTLTKYEDYQALAPDPDVEGPPPDDQP